ncbi:D-aspartate ligase [Trueperella bonasi]|uniref:D-aspartate ligase n=1 Tax=Trueperella bonasi TaxID=312286 RepID=A0ABT9NHB4_9ACTO|nr:ATP-grasp domain-containing protein [Trueperella bonasi]MDP9806799.1 D-aspartate ligase [Trueperella bonasi]
MDLSSSLVPIIFGWDLGDYAMARLIHENSGVRPRLYSQINRGFIDDSKILDLHITQPRGISEPAKFEELLAEIAKEFPTDRVVPLANSDEHVQQLAELRPNLPQSWLLPYAPAEAFAIADSKTRLAGVADTLGLATPKHVLVNTGDPAEADSMLESLTFPIVLKPDERSELNFHTSRGLAKVKPCATHQEAVDEIARLRDAGVSIGLTAQELIPGDDTTQWVVNGYIARNGAVSAIGSGRVLLGNHNPDLLGNAGIIHVIPNDDLMADAQRLVTAVGLRGFFSIDVKIDPRTNTAYWLDLNPRIGRNHYYLKVGGVDLWQALIDDVAGVPSYQRMAQEGLYHVLPLRMLNSKYIRDPQLRKHVRGLRRNAVDPSKYGADRHPRRALFRRINSENMARKTRAHYPRATDTGF